MKKMVCEICDSQKFKKENDSFVCQGCGTEYSLEQAKKLLKEDIEDNAKKCESESIKENVANSKEEKIDLLFKLKCWLQLIRKFNKYKFWTGKNYKNEEGFWNSFLEDFSTKTKVSKLESDDFIKLVFSEDINSPTLLKFREKYGDIHPMIYRGEYAQRFMGDILDNIKANLLIESNNLYKFWDTFAKEKNMGYQQTKFFKTTWYSKYFFEINGVKKETSELDYIEKNIESFVNFCIKNYESKNKIKIYENVVDWNGNAIHVKYNLTLHYYSNVIDSYLKDTYTLFDSLSKMYNSIIEEYSNNFETIKNEFIQLKEVSLELEKLFFLPYAYRDEKTIVYLINIIKDGRADNWKETINIYKDDLAKERIVHSLYSMENILLSLKEIIEDGMGVIVNSLRSIDNNLSSMCNQLDSINAKITNIMYDTRFSLIHNLMK